MAAHMAAQVLYVPGQTIWCKVACLYLCSESMDVPRQVGESSTPQHAYFGDAPLRDVSTPVSDSSSGDAPLRDVSTPVSSATSNSPLIPDYWRPEVQDCIREKMLTTSARNEIVRTLVNQIFARMGKKPTRAQCEDCSRRLILKYPLFKDDMGNGYVSTVDPDVCLNHQFRWG